MPNERANETTAMITGLGLVGLALYCGLSLHSYSATDIMGYDASTGGQISNQGGQLGAKVAHHLKCLYGVGSWVIAFGLLIIGGMICTARSFEGAIVRGLGALLLTTVVCTWAGTMTLPSAPETAFAYDSYPTGLGGLVGGRYIGQPLVDQFGKVGVYLVLVTVGLLAGLMTAQHMTEFALASVGRCFLNSSKWCFGVLARLKVELVERLGGWQPAPASTGVFPGVKRPDSEGAAEFDPARYDKRIAVEVEAVEPKSTRKVRVKIEEEEKDEEFEDQEESDFNKASTKHIEPAPQKSESKLTKDEKDAVLAQQRRAEAVRQAEEAEKNRLQREKEEEEKREREAKALAKLERERELKKRAMEKNQAKFMAAMSSTQPPKEHEKGDDATPAKPRLPDDYRLPDLNVLIEKDVEALVSSEDLKERGAKLIETLWEFKIGSRLVNISHGPTVTMFELGLDPGIKVSRVIGLQDNLSMAMKAENGVRIIAPLPGRDTIGIEIPNAEGNVVRMRPIIESTAFRAGKFTLPLVLGRDATGNPLIADLVRMPHLLIAGTTGSGKSVCVNSIILSIMLLRRPQDVKLILVDPKQVEMTDFKGIPHLLSPVVSDMKLAAGVLTWATQKMDERYERMGKVGVRNIATFNKLSREDRLARIPKNEAEEEYFDPMPYIVVIVDEFADLMMTSGKEIEQSIARLAQKARAAGIHVILATQRPSNDVVTGLIKTNLPCRISFQVKSKIDSRIVLDSSGAEKLAGKGDMLFIPPGTSQLLRAKGVYVEDEEIKRVVEFCKKQAAPIYTDEVERVASGSSEDPDMEELPLDERFDEGVECFLSLGRASTSLLQRRMGVGYTRAAKLCDQMESRGIVGPDRGAKGRGLLITDESWEAYKMGKLEKSAWGPLGSKDNPGANPLEEDEVEATLSARADLDEEEMDAEEGEENNEADEVDENDDLDRPEDDEDRADHHADRDDDDDRDDHDEDEWLEKSSSRAIERVAGD